MGAEKRLQRLMDRVARKGGNTITIDGTDRSELQSKLIDNKASSSQWKRAKKLADKVMPSFQGVRPVENMSDEEAEKIHNTGSVSRKSALNMLGVSSPLNACWKTGGPNDEGYTQQGTKKKGDRTVPNCVPAASVKK